MPSSAFQLQAIAELATTDHFGDNYSEGDYSEGDDFIIFQWDDEEVNQSSSPSVKNVHMIDYVLMAAMFAIIAFLWMQ